MYEPQERRLGQDALLPTLASRVSRSVLRLGGVRRRFGSIFAVHCRCPISVRPQHPSSLWRISVGGRIRRTSNDHGQQFDLPRPVDAPAEASAILRGHRIVSVRVDEARAEMTFEFDSGVASRLLPILPATNLGLYAALDAHSSAEAAPPFTISRLRSSVALQPTKELLIVRAPRAFLLGSFAAELWR